MSYTEEEAKQKWCPSPPMVIRYGGVGDGGDLLYIQCEGSRCMAWRWDDDRSGVLKDWTFRKVGYCGLAGKP